MITYTFYRYSPKERAQIGKYAMEHGVSAAAMTLSRKLNIQLSKTTVCSIHDGYLGELRKRRRAGDHELLHKFSERQHGRSLPLDDSLEEKLQLYIRKVREGGEAVLSKIVMAAARGMLLFYDSSKLVENGGHIHLNRH